MYAQARIEMAMKCGHYLDPQKDVPVVLSTLNNLDLVQSECRTGSACSLRLITS